jgi:hypothetical protein
VILGEDDELAIRRETPIPESPARTTPWSLCRLTLSLTLILALALLDILDLLIDADLAVAVLPASFLDHLLLALLVLTVFLPLLTLTLAQADLLIVPLFLLSTAVLAILTSTASTTSPASKAEHSSEPASLGLAELGEVLCREVVLVAEVFEDEADLRAFIVQNQALDRQ